MIRLLKNILLTVKVTVLYSRRREHPRPFLQISDHRGDEISRGRLDADGHRQGRRHDEEGVRHVRQVRPAGHGHGEVEGDGGQACLRSSERAPVRTGQRGAASPVSSASKSRVGHSMS